MSAFYNEHDPFAAAWLRELIKEGLIADGEVDERSIEDVKQIDVAGFTQCHFFAGIGGWSYALRLAGWPDTRSVWTGSCPCQPFSAAGANLGGTDPRHLWPAWYRLIRECRPTVVFGEQVESAIAHGWLDLVCDDLERDGYACGAVGLPAASVGAPHIRQRLWFVAENWAVDDANEHGRRARRGGDGADERLLDGSASEHGGGMAESNGGHARTEGLQRSGEHGLRAEGRYADGPAGDAERAEAGIVAESNAARHARAGQQALHRERDHAGTVASVNGRGDAGELADADAAGSSQQRQPELTGERGASGHLTNGRGEVEQLGEPFSARLERLTGNERDGHQPGRVGADTGRSTAEAGAWDDLLWLPCRDGKARPTQSGLFPLAHGVSNRVGTLRGAGNAIVPQVAAEVIRAYLT